MDLSHYSCVVVSNCCFNLKFPNDDNDEQIKTTMRYYFTPIRMGREGGREGENNKLTSVGEDIEKLEPLRTAGGNVK